MWIKTILLFASGGIGTLARYALSAFVQNLTGSHFPFGTATVNILGCFLFGTVWSLVEEIPGVPSNLRVYVLTGFMGAFTTFSTFAFESMAMARFGQHALAMANVVGQTALGLLALYLGMVLVKICI